MKGTYLRNDRSKWVATAMINKKRIYLGLFNNREDAKAAYDKAINKLKKRPSMSKKTELMNLRDYAKIFPKSMVESNRGSKEGEGVTRQAILNRVTKGLELPYVTKIELIGRQYILHVQKP